MMHEPWAFICEIGFWGWMLSTTGFVLKAFPFRNTFHKKPAVVWGGFLLFFYAVWVAGMVMA